LSNSRPKILSRYDKAPQTSTVEHAVVSETIAYTETVLASQLMAMARAMA